MPSGGQQWEPSGRMVLAGTAATPTQKERVRLPLPGLKQYVYRAEFLAVVRALEKCHPHEVVSDCKGVVKACKPCKLDEGCPKGDLDLECAALLPGQRSRWMKLHHESSTETS
eukprot:2223932-Amphidinium_carterae.2